MTYRVGSCPGAPSRSRSSTCSGGEVDVGPHRGLQPGHGPRPSPRRRRTPCCGRCGPRRPGSRLASTRPGVRPGRRRAPLQPVLEPAAQAQHHVPGERVDPLEALLGILGTDLPPGAVVLVGVERHRAVDQAELRRLVVGHQQQVGPDPSPAQVLRAVAGRRPSARRPTGGDSGESRVDQPGLAGVPALGQDQDRVAAAALPERQLEPLVRLDQHPHVVRDGGADPVPPHLVRPVGLVVHGVEEPRRVRAPGAAVVAARHHVGEVGAGAQVAEPQGEHLVAGGVDGVGEQVLVGADQGQAEVEVAAVVGQRADVQQHLTESPRGAVFVGRLARDHRIRYRNGLGTTDFPDQLTVVTSGEVPHVVGKPQPPPRR